MECLQMAMSILNLFIGQLLKQIQRLMRTSLEKAQHGLALGKKKLSG